jgi:hypothetical protein
VAALEHIEDVHPCRQVEAVDSCYNVVEEMVDDLVEHIEDVLPCEVVGRQVEAVELCHNVVEEMVEDLVEALDQKHAVVDESVAGVDQVVDHVPSHNETAAQGPSISSHLEELPPSICSTQLRKHKHITMFY